MFYLRVLFSSIMPITLEKLHLIILSTVLMCHVSTQPCGGTNLETALVSLLPESCTLTLWKMTSETTKVKDQKYKRFMQKNKTIFLLVQHIGEDSKISLVATRGMVVFDQEDMDLDDVTRESICLTGISDVQQVIKIKES